MPRMVQVNGGWMFLEESRGLGGELPAVGKSKFQFVLGVFF